MKIICTPSHGPLAVIVDVDTGEMLREVPQPEEMITLGRRPFGIAQDTNGNWYIAKDTAIGYFNRDITTLTYLLGGLPGGDIHQLFYDPVSQELWVALTGLDSLLAINLQTQAIRRFCLLTDQWLPLDVPGKDTHHFNSVIWYSDRLHVVAHRFGQGSSFVRTYDRNMNRISLWQAGTAAHNVMEYKNQLLLLDSQGGHILGEQGLKIKVCGPESYTRGMVISPEGIALVAVFKFGGRETRIVGDAYLRGFNLETGEQVMDLLMPDVGNIQDIKWWNPSDGL